MKKNVSLISVKVHQQKGHTHTYTLKHTHTHTHTHTEFLGTLFCKVLALLPYQL